jgi:hypothetical protein
LKNVQHPIAREKSAKAMLIYDLRGLPTPTAHSLRKPDSEYRIPCAPSRFYYIQDKNIKYKYKPSLRIN